MHRINLQSGAYIDVHGTNTEDTSLKHIAIHGSLREQIKRKVKRPQNFHMINFHDQIFLMSTLTIHCHVNSIKKEV